MKRKELREWLADSSHDEPPEDPLGLPEEGPGSRARLGRRIVALFVDWWASWLVAYLIFGESDFGALGVFAVMQIVLLATVGASFGHRICGMGLYRIVTPSTTNNRGKGNQPTFVPGGIGIIPAVIRTVLLCLVIPAVVWDINGLGLHDKAARTVLLRRS